MLGTPVTEAGLSSIPLDSAQTKASVLSALHRELGHLVHSSRLHEMSNLERVFLFYQAEICVLTPYEALHRDQEADLLPPNLVIQLEPHRFTGQGDNRLDQVNIKPCSLPPSLPQVTAWPRSDTLVTGLRAREKYASRPAEHSQYEETDYD